jgi:hypothetical protein
MPFNSTQAKTIFASTTFWGSVVSLLGVVAPHFLANLTNGASQSTVVSYIVAAVGFVVTVYGRFTAKQVVTLTGANPPGGGGLTGSKG